MSNSRRFHHSGSYKWFLSRIVPFLTENNPRFAYYFVLVNKHRKDFVDFRATIYHVQERLEELSEAIREPVEKIFTEAHVFLSGPEAHRKVLTPLRNQGFIDLDAESIVSGNRETRTRRALNAVRTTLLGTGKCFDPYEVAEVDITAEKTLLYILDKKFKLQQVICLDDDSFRSLFGPAKEQPRYSEDALTEMETAIRNMESPSDQAEAEAELAELRQQTIVCNPDIRYQCKEIRHEDDLIPIRRLPLSFPVYIYESDAQTMELRTSYALYPSSEEVGKIMSDCVRLGSDLIGAEHCQTDHQDRIYHVRPVPSRVRNAPNLGQELRNLFGTQGGRHRTFRKRRNQARHLRRVLQTRRVL